MSKNVWADLGNVQQGCKNVYYVFIGIKHAEVLFPQRQTAAALTLLRAYLNTLKRRLADKIVRLNVKPPSSELLV